MSLLVHAHAVRRFGERGQRGRDEVEGRGVGTAVVLMAMTLSYLFLILRRDVDLHM